MKKIMNMAREAVTMANEAGNIELAQKVLDLQSEANLIQEELSNLKEENRRLRDASDIDSKLIMKRGVYFLEDDSVHESRRGPFCTQCWAMKQKLVPLEVIAEDEACYDCHTCDARFGDISAPPPPLFG